ncbi:MAG: DUF3854 domain-containing protein [Terracidiphilus sp.]
MSSTSQRQQKLKAWLKSHGLNLADNRKLRTSPVTQGEAARELQSRAPADGFKIPYFDLNRKPTGFVRYRFDDHASFTKPIRYRQAADSGTHVYFAPLLPWKKIAADPKIQILVVEGELKAASACAHGFACVGLGGVTLWHERGQRELHPDLAPFEWRERPVAIVFDSDAATNKQVRVQESALTLAFAGVGARVKIVRLPEEAS